MMGFDKHEAKKGNWRVSEKTLFTLVVLGGSIGGILGMFTFRHKTKKWYFALPKCNPHPPDLSEAPDSDIRPLPAPFRNRQGYVCRQIR